MPELQDEIAFKIGGPNWGEITHQFLSQMPLNHLTFFLVSFFVSTKSVQKQHSNIYKVFNVQDVVNTNSHN